MPTYIHVTTSATLAILPRTNFELSSLKELLYKHHIAPLAGEVSCGGFSGLTMEGETRFAKMHDSYWQMDSLHRSYGSTQYRTTFDSANKFFTDFNSICSNFLINIQANIVHALRDHQMGKLPRPNEEQISQLQEKFNSTLSQIKKIYMMNYLASRYLVEEKHSASETFENELKFIFGLVDTVPENFIDLDDESQKEFVNKLTLPPNLQIRDAKALGEQNPKITKLNWGIANVVSFPAECNDYGRRCISHDHFSRTIETFDPNWAFYPDIEEIKNVIARAVIHVDNIKVLFEKIIHGDLINIRYDNHPYVVNPFPIGFILDDEGDLLEPLKYEFCAKKNLKLGQHVKKILTDDAHLSSVKAYLAQHQLSVEVELFSKYLRPAAPTSNVTAMASASSSLKIHSLLTGSANNYASTMRDSVPLYPASTSSSLMQSQATASGCKPTLMSAASPAYPPYPSSSINATTLSKPSFLDWMNIHSQLPEKFNLQDITKLIEQQKKSQLSLNNLPFSPR